MGQSIARWTDRGAARQHVRNVRLEIILQSAARCFNRKGYQATKMGDIARELGVSKAALYYYVKSKEEIIFQCHSAALDVAMEGVQMAEALADPADVKLYVALRHFIEGMTDRLNGCVVLTEGMLSPRLYRDLVRRRDEYERRLRRIVEEGVASEAFAPWDPKMVVLAMLGAMNWIPRWYSPDGERTPKEIGETFARYLVRGLGQGGFHEHGSAV
ncbi:MAG: TetR/AcrR family transcriptional regulator [Candidatus Rokubacteria bacterium]|nr:TetR/AcrR family transcriptional regulator [Candidatus Rokubacteria bacterium]